MTSTMERELIKEWLAQVSAGLSQGAIAMLLTLLAASGVHPQYVLLP